MDTPNMQQLTLVPTSITGVHGIELPPDDFDPRNADTATLIRYGFPPQPDPRTKAAAVWQRTFSRKLRFVQPALSSRQEDKEGPRSVPPAAISTTPLSSNNWSGGVLFDGAPFDGIIAPGPYPPCYHRRLAMAIGGRLPLSASTAATPTMCCKPVRVNM